MKTVLSITSFVLSCLMATAQSAFPALGGDVSNANGCLSYTVGQVETRYVRARVTNAETLSASMQEGVQQSYLINDLGVAKSDGIAARLSPNPTVDEITIEIISAPGQYCCELYTIEGSLLLQSGFLGNTHTVNMGSFPSGSYMLRLYGNGRESIFRIVKVK